MAILRESTVHIATTLYQIVLVGFLGAFVFYLGGFLIGGIVWMVTGNGHTGIVIGPVIAAILMYLLYAVGWCAFWYVLRRTSQGWRLYTRILLGWVPLIAYLVFFRPIAPDPMSMQLVSVPNQFLFSSAVTGVVLYPLYSIWLNRVAFVSVVRTRQKRVMYSSFAVLLIVSMIVYPVAWQTMHLIYH